MSEPPDRVADLERQRALVREQLAWLDREIEAAHAARGTPPRAPAPPTPARAEPQTAENLAYPAYAPNPTAAHAEGRRGCFLYAIAAFALLIAALTVIYFVRYRDRSLIFVERSAQPSSASQRSPSPHK